MKGKKEEKFLAPK